MRDKSHTFKPSALAYPKTLWITILTFPVLLGTPYLYTLYKKNRTTYQVTDSAVVYEYRGILATKTDSIPNDEISGVDTRQVWWLRSLDIGSVEVRSNNNAIEFPAVKRQSEMREAVNY